MKIIAFFSKFTFICNIAFLLFIIFSKIESKKAATGGNNNVVDSIPFFKSLVITLGFSAIIINLLMCLVYAILLGMSKKYLLPKWIPLINFVFLIVQFYFFFF
jgi:hypothetical protein